MSWVAVAPSAWQRRLCCFGVAVGGGVTAATLATLLAGPGPLAAAIGVPAALAAGGLASTLNRRFPSDLAWSVAADGRIAVRDRDAVCRDAAIVFVSPLLIVLRPGRRSLEIWRDAAPIAAFRRLNVAARWRLPRERAAG